MIIETYQSRLVLDILKSGSVYRAKPNLRLKGEYAALIDMLGLSCECPIFGVIKGKKQRTFGKVSGSVKLILDVPEEEVHLTEFSQWADFLYAYQFTMPGNYRSLKPSIEGEITHREFQELLTALSTEKKLSEYKSPQVVLEKLEPSWLRSYKLLHVGRKDIFSRLRRALGK